MKKVLVAMAVMMGVGSFNAFAAETGVDSVAIVSVQSNQDEYTKIEVKDVPEVVTQAIEKAYAGQTIKEASVTEKEGAKQYKIVLATAEGVESTVIFNDKGEEVK